MQAYTDSVTVLSHNDVCWRETHGLLYGVFDGSGMLQAFRVSIVYMK